MGWKPTGGGGTNTHADIDDFIDFFNGSFMEQIVVSYAEAAGVVTLSLTGVGVTDLTQCFSDGLTAYDTTPADTIALTVGSDTSMQENYIYIPQSTKVLTKSTTAFPTAEHIKVAFLLVPSAARVSALGVVAFHVWGDESLDSDNQGHMSHITERQRRMGARWHSGVDGNGTSDYLTLGAGTVDFKSTSGVVYQMHAHVFAAVDTSVADTVLVKNWSGDAYHDITDLYDITVDSDGNAIGNNKWFNLVFWGVNNQDGTYQPIMVNLPGGAYNTQSGAEGDDDGFDDFSIPNIFSTISSTGFLIARMTLQMKTGGGTWGFASIVDLRGYSPITAKGGAAAQVTEFADNTFNIHDEADDSKVLKFSVGGISPTTDRTVTVPDASGTLEYTGHQHPLLILPIKATTGDPGSPSEGQIYVNTFDNKVRVYADAAWRDLATW
jgi:hypothetical protein